MKRTFLIVLAMFLVSAISSTSRAQQADAADYKAMAKAEKVITDQLKKAAIKDARKQAKQYEKEGWRVPIGKLPLEKQLEESQIMQATKSKDGSNYYIWSNVSAKGGSQSAASMQAINQAKVMILGQITTEVAQLIDAKVANQELGGDDAVTLNEFISTNKSLVEGKLGRVIPVVEVYRTLPNKNTEVQVMLFYSSELATKEALKAIRTDLYKKSTKLGAELDKILASTPDAEN